MQPKESVIRFLFLLPKISLLGELRLNFEIQTAGRIIRNPGTHQRIWNSTHTINHRHDLLIGCNHTHCTE